MINRRTSDPYFRSSMRFSDRVIAVTGGGSGIGLQISKDLYAEGASVHILGRDIIKLAKAKEQIENIERTSGQDISDIFIHRCDVSDYDRVQEAFRNIKETSGNIYGLVNNAAINPSRNDILHTEAKDWLATLDVNLNGAFNCSKAAVAQMLDLGRGSIVNISSVGGLNAFRNRTSYNASKFGLIGLTESMAMDYAQSGIRVNAICPGYVRTELTASLFEMLGPGKTDQLISAHAMMRLGRPEEISRAVLFLLSDEASFITGVALPVDGGYLLKG